MPKNESDFSLVNRVRAGDAGAFGRIVERYQGALTTVARASLGSVDDAADAVQDALVLAYLHLNQLQDPNRLGPWLRRVTVNACHRVARTRPPTVPLDAIANISRDERVALDTRLLVEQALTCLSAETGLTVMLYYRREMSLAEIAQFQEVPITTVKSRLRNARARLRKELETALEETITQKLGPEDVAPQVFRRIEAAGGIYSGTVSPDGRLFVTGVMLDGAGETYDAQIAAWDVETGDPAWTYALTSWFRSVLFTQDGRYVVFSTGLPGHRDGLVGRIVFLDTATGAFNREVVTPRGATALALSPDGCYIAAGLQEEYEDYRSHGDKGVVRIYALNTSEQVQVLEPHLNLLQALAFSPDGKTLASSGIVRDADPEAKAIWLRGDVRLWDLTAGTKRHQLERPGANGTLHTIAFSCDGSLLAAPNGPEGEVLLWDPVAGKTVRTLPGFGSQVCGLAFSPDMRLLATGEKDGPVRLFDLATGQLQQTLRGHTDPVMTVAFTPNGSRLITADNRGSVRFWPLHPMPIRSPRNVQ